MALLSRVWSRASSAVRSARYRRVFRRFQPFTTIPRHSYVENLTLAARVAHIPGCVVECGVWRGGMIAGVASILRPSRRFYLCDSFEGMPPAKSIDGAAAARWQHDTTSPHYHSNGTAGEEYAIQEMALAGIGSPTLVKRWFNPTLLWYVLDTYVRHLTLNLSHASTTSRRPPPARPPSTGCRRIAVGRRQSRGAMGLATRLPQPLGTHGFTHADFARVHTFPKDAPSGAVQICRDRRQARPGDRRITGLHSSEALSGRWRRQSGGHGA